MGDVQAGPGRQFLVRPGQHPGECVRRFRWSSPWGYADEWPLSPPLKEIAMKIEVDAKLVTIYINSTDQWHGRSLYSAIVHLCQQKGIAGATVSRCVEGYGASQRLHTT